MRLRRVVKVSQRRENDHFHEPNPQQMRHRARSPEPPRYIDYDPNLPPSAFPTFDQPRRLERVDDGFHSQDSKDIQLDKEGSRASLTQNNNICNDSRKGHKVTGVDLGSIPSDLLESCVASNGDLNPIYMRNMAIMSRADQNQPLTYHDMEDSDTNDAVVDISGRTLPKVSTGPFESLEPWRTPDNEAIPIPSPEWSDLSPRIQVEILDNLLELYNWPAASHILGLTAEECEKAQEYMALREAQTNLENSHLRRMREKQLKSLLKIDNSALKHNRTPHRLVFRRTSRQYCRKLGEAIDIDFFSCHLGEIENAGRFLDKRGIDRSYAGKWTSSVAYLKATEGDTRMHEQENAALEPGPPPSNASDLTNDFTMGEISNSTSDQQPNLNPNKPYYPGRTEDLFMRQGDPILFYRPSSISRNDELRDCLREASQGVDLLHINIGTQQAALLRDSEYSCIEPLKLVKSLPPMIRLFAEPSPSKPSPDTTTRRHPMPTMASSMRLRQKLEQVKLEAQRTRSEVKSEKEVSGYSSNDDWPSAFSLPKGWPVSFNNCPQPTSPGRVLRERDPEHIHLGDMFSFGDTMSTTTSESNDQFRATPVNDSECSAPPSPSPSSIGFSDNLQSMTTFTPDADCTDYDEEPDQEDDEMVLVPTDSSNSGC